MQAFCLKEYSAHPDRKVVTRKGNEVEIISTNGRGPFPVIGYIGDNRMPSMWNSNGCFMDDVTVHPNDLFFADGESEDERIRNKIIDYLSNELHNVKQLTPLTNEVEAWIAYLEKQKEQKPAEWSEDWREEDIQTRFAFYTYKNEEDDGVLYLSNVFVEEASRNHGFGTKILAAAEKVAETIGATTISLKVKQDSPANAWYRKNGYGYVAFEDGYDWLEKNLEYMKPVKSAEWSEEDELNLNWVIAILNGEPCDLDIQLESLISWLKSLRPQPQSKDTYYDIIHDILVTLKDMDFTQITPEHRVSLLNDIRVKCKNADECAEILDEPIKWHPRWHCAKAGTKLPSEAVIIYDMDREPRMGKVMVHNGRYMLVKELEELPGGIDKEIKL